MTREQIEQLRGAAPADKAAIYNPYTVVERRNGRATDDAVPRAIQAVSRADGAAICAKPRR